MEESGNSRKIHKSNHDNEDRQERVSFMSIVYHQREKQSHNLKKSQEDNYIATPHI